MSMKWFIIECIVGFLVFSPLSAQKSDFSVALPCDTAQISASSEGSAESDIRLSRYDRRVHRYRKRWQNLIPTHTKVQFAGNMGLLSLGTGWDYGKHDQWETDIFLGILPKYDSRCTKLTFTVKQNYIPWNLDLGRRFFLDPLTCGMYLNTVFGEDFWFGSRSVIRMDITAFHLKYAFTFS